MALLAEVVTEATFADEAITTEKAIAIADLALPIPNLDAVVPVDDVQPYGKTVDDEADEPALLVDLARLGGDFDREVGFAELVRMMVEADLEKARREKTLRDAGHKMPELVGHDQ